MAEVQLVSFRVNEDFLGVDIRLVREVHPECDVTPVSPALPHVAGLMNLRGQILTVIDLAARLGIPRPSGGSAAAHGVVLKTMRELDRLACRDDLTDHTGVDPVVFLVDRIGDIVTIDSSLVDPPPAHIGPLDGRFLSGVAKLDHDLLVVLKVSEILRIDPDISIAS